MFHKKREEVMPGGQEQCFTRKEKRSCTVVRSCVSQEKRRGHAWWSGAVFHKKREEVVHGGQELCFTRKACSEPMVEMYQNVVFFEIVFYLIELKTFIVH